ncbi:hypothetical protein A3D77_02015 [Candidatus Gottesmanbacteria bacterium RIFCSPHIGHO2_02_FULL_39_11]|uniref:Mannosyl-glycoprotein endo-beta-N-acetylglucosamidase-like domain-containing protein n=1 Tax=Candidatus Gottesmanbacteria bacterium RIFCSPHIGHO2_02_FULL_39_11 TaxID=1798382 RepID=A0A1F5ZUC0_9BACT|nr:MAG: hypothetical protein A3D77_02015 [Candidatus Gottesmanbacteria bacterium RIFCSPHIGHO2_02_FULL_39_11]
MKKIFVIIALLLIGLSLTRKVHASMADISDLRVQKEIEAAQERIIKIETVRKYLKKHNSELAAYSEKLVKEAEKNEIPWHLVAAISGVESTFCKRIPYESYNCWGWNNGNTYFKDYEDAITIVSTTLGKKYFGRGLDTPEKIAPVYAPPSHTWAGKVRWFMAQIESSKS